MFRDMLIDSLHIYPDQAMFYYGIELVDIQDFSLGQANLLYDLYLDGL